MRSQRLFLFHHLLFLILCCSKLSLILSQPMNRNGKFLPFVLQKSIGSVRVPEITLPNLDNSLLRVFESAAKSGRVQTGSGSAAINYHTGPYKFGHHLNIGPIDTVNNGSWFNLPNNRGRVWRLRISSPSALSLNFVFDRFKLPIGSEFYIHGETTILGAYIPELNNKPHQKFTSPPILGKFAFLEYYEPLTVSEPVVLAIRTIVHGFDYPFGKSGLLKDPELIPIYPTSTANSNESSTCGNSQECYYLSDFSGQGLSENCEVNVVCPHNKKWDPMMKSVVHLTLMDGSALCTGTLMNNAKGDGEQLILTAEHCIAAYMDSKKNGTSPFDHDLDTVTFNFEASDCDSRNTSSVPTDFPSLQGLNYLGSSPLSDYALLLVQDRIPEELNVYMAGWTTETNYTAPEFSRVVAIHHPNGDVKKISYSNNRTLKATCWNECATRKAYHILVSQWDKGATEEGSSGSALFNNNGVLIGQLHGGLSNCDRPIKDFYGSFPASYHLGLSKFIDPRGKFKKGLRRNGIWLNIARNNNKK